MSADFSKPRAYKSANSSESVPLKLCKKCSQRLVLDECQKCSEFTCSQCSCSCTRSRDECLGSESLFDYYIVNPLANTLMATKLF